MNFTKMGDTPQQRFEQLQMHDNESIKRTATEIAEITWKDQEQQKVQLEWILTTEFANTLDQTTANTLLTEANKAKEAKWENYTELDELIAFLEPIANPHKIEWDISEVTDNNEQKKAASIIEKFSDYFWEGKTLSNIPEWIDNSIKTTIENIKKILNNPTKDNIKKLQKFLWNNVDWELKKMNSKDAPQTWNFANKTEKDLNTFLKKTEDYVNKYNAHLEIAKNGDQQQQKIENVKNKINNLNNIQDIEQTTNDYNSLSEWEKAQIEETLIQKLEEVKKTLNSLNNKMGLISANITNILENNTSTDQQKIYELTKLLRDKITTQEAQILLNEIPNNTNNNSGIIISGINITQYTEIFNQALTNITKDNIQNQETEAQKQENIQAQIEQNNNASKSFDEISTELQKIWNEKIYAILTQIAPLNEKLKQWHSINYLKAEESRLIQAIKKFWWENISFKENWKIESWLDKDEKKRFRKEIRDLEKQLMDVRKELENKQKIKDKIYKNENNTESWMITEIKNIIPDEKNKDYYTWAIDSYINNLDNMWQDVEDKQNDTKEWEKATNEKWNPIIEQGKTVANQAPRNKPTPNNLSALFEKVWFTRNPEDWFWKNVWNAFGAIFGWLFWFTTKWKESWIKTPEQKSDDLKIDLTQFESESEIKTTLEEINNITQEFNGRKEIVDTINSKDPSKIANLQRKLRTFPNWGQESPIKITWEIDETTATALQTYAEKQSKQNEQNNWTEMPYAFCEWYSKINTAIQNTEVYKEDWENTINYIVIQKDESWNISSITKWELEYNQTVSWETSTIPTFKNTAETYKLWTWENGKTIVKKEQQTN